MLEIGSSLREARRRRGLELAEAAAATMIRTRYLEALENEQFHVLPEGPYLRSFLREYAEFLGLDGDILVSEWMLRFAPPAPEPPERQPHVAAAFLSSLPRRRTLFVGGTLVAIALTVWLLGSSNPTTVPSSLPGPSRPQQVSLAPQSKPKTVPRKSARPLVLTAARGPCWLLVRIGSASGPVVHEGTLQQGGVVRFGTRQPLWIRLGAPWNVDVSIAGRSLTGSLPVVTGNVIVTAAGVRSA